MLSEFFTVLSHPFHIYSQLVKIIFHRITLIRLMYKPPRRRSRRLTLCHHLTPGLPVALKRMPVPLPILQSIISFVCSVLLPFWL
nr:MAG TPA: hypothetical protein [Caudoviricetes sp.]